MKPSNDNCQCPGNPSGKKGLFSFLKRNRGNGGPQNNEPGIPDPPQRTYHDILIFCRQDGQEMGQQVFDYLSMQGYDCVIMEMDDAFPAKSVEYRREWDQRVFHGKDLIIIYSEAMADAMLNPMTDVHHLLRIILPEIGTVNIFKFNLQVYVEHYCKLNLNFGKVERIRKQLEGDGYYSDILGSTTVYPLRIIGYKKESGRYAVQAVKNYLKSDKR